MRFARLTCSGLISLALVACGGGGGGSEPAADYLVGSYSAQYTKTQDNCAIGGGYNGALHQVSVNGADVTVQINTLTLRGSVRSDGGLSAIYEVISTGVTTRAVVTYAMPAGQSAPGNGTFNSELLVQGIDNSSGFTCNLRYNGTVTKVG